MRLVRKNQTPAKGALNYNRNVATSALYGIESDPRWKRLKTGYEKGKWYPIAVNGVNLVGYGTTLGNNPKTRAKLTKRGNGDPMKGWLTDTEALNTAHYDLNNMYKKLRKDATEYDQRADTVSFNAWLPALMSKYQEGNIGNIYKQYTDAAINGDVDEMKRLVGTTEHADDSRRKYMQTVDIYRGIWPRRKL